MKQFKANKNTNGIEVFLDSARGVYIPQTWLETIVPAYWDTVTPYARDVLEQGPEHEEYWSVWGQILDYQFCKDTDGNEWTLYQDGDLFLVCDALMSDGDYFNLYGEQRASA